MANIRPELALTNTAPDYEGGLNTNRLAFHAIGEVPLKFMERLPKGDAERRETIQAIAAEYNGIGAIQRGVGFGLRDLTKQATFMRSSRAAGLKVVDCLGFTDEAMISPFIEGMPLDKYIQQEPEAIQPGVINGLLSHTAQAHSLDIIFGDRWVKNTIVTPDNDIVEIDFDVELHGEMRHQKAFELAQTLYHLLHFAGKNRPLVLDAIKDTYISRPTLLAGYDGRLLVDFIVGHSDHFYGQYERTGEKYEGMIPPTNSVIALVAFLENAFSALPKGAPTNSIPSPSHDSHTDVLMLADALVPRHRSQKGLKAAHDMRHTYISDPIMPSNIVAYDASGAEINTSRGRLIDMASMTVNCILGQNDPWVNANVMGYMLSGSPSFLTSTIGGRPYYSVAQRILGLSGFEDGVINHRQTNGTDVTELAVASAYHFREPGRSKLISFEGSYHGQGLTAYHISGLLQRNKFLINDAPVEFLGQPSDTVDFGEPGSALSENDSALLRQLEDMAEEVFGVIVEPIQVNGNMVTLNRTFLQGLQEVCHRYKISLIYDEVQTGSGWLGNMTAAQVLGVKPDLLALSKALTSGHGALSVLVSERKYQKLARGQASKTNGADVRALVAADAVMDRLFGIDADEIPPQVSDDLRAELQDGFLATFDSRQQRLADCLQSIQLNSRDRIRSVKGTGFIKGLEIVDAAGRPDPTSAAAIQASLLQAGVLVRNSGSNLIVKPPIVIKENQLADAADIIQTVIRDA